jgi:hypothetical protein
MGNGLVILLVLLALGGSGCGGEESATVSGDGYSYDVPEGWADRTEESLDIPEVELAGFRPDTVVVGERHDGFSSNVNVVREPGIPEDFTAARYAQVAIGTLRDPASSGFPPEVVERIESMEIRDLTELGKPPLGGERGAAWEYASTREGRPLRARQLAAVRGNSAYTLTYTASPEGFEEGLPGFEKVIESWRWN